MKDGCVRELTLTVEARMLPAFFRLLQDGFVIETRVGVSVGEFLENRCNLSPETIAARIATVFLDGQPVDDIERAFVRDRCTLALSGAMPGLVGAVMRSDSPLRSFRSSITHESDEGASERKTGMIRVKLFNTVIGELGPSLLREGILLEPASVQDFMKDRLGARENGVTDIVLDGTATVMGSVIGNEQLTDSDLIAVSVRTNE